MYGSCPIDHCRLCRDLLILEVPFREKVIYICQTWTMWCTDWPVEQYAREGRERFALLLISPQVLPRGYSKKTCNT